jgi:hypothetical protein
MEDMRPTGVERRGGGGGGGEREPRIQAKSGQLGEERDIDHQLLGFVKIQ